MRHLRLHDPGPPRLWKIGYALTVCFLAALAGLAVLWLAAQALLSHPQLPHPKVLSLHDTVGVAQLVFASVAGMGALVALVMAYRRQRVAETATAHDRSRVLNERFTTIAAQLGDDQAAVRLAGVHAMAGLADDWKENRQTCIDVLCAYLRMPYEPDPGEEAPAAERLAFRSSREVRHTVIRVITAHLIKDAPMSWQGLNFDFTGVVFDGGNFTSAEFTGGEVSFDGAMFSGGEVSFDGAMFSGGEVSFDDGGFTGCRVLFTGARFAGGEVNFGSARFSGARFYFDGAEFTGARVYFNGAFCTGSMVYFDEVGFTGGEVHFSTAEFKGAGVYFSRAEFTGAEVHFRRAEFTGSEVGFDGARFTGGGVNFGSAEFASGEVSFDGAMFSGGEVSFDDAGFTGTRVHFTGARFAGGTVDFSCAADWSHPPSFDWEGAPPQGVKLPAAGGAAQP